MKFPNCSIMKKIRPVVPLVVLLALFVTSCIGCNKTGTTETTSTVGTTQTGGKGTLNLTDDGPITLDPALVAEAGSDYYITQIFSGLTHIDSDLEVVGDIAERWEQSADGLTYTFYLRPEARFHDGRRVTAADFKYSWERALNPATGSITASLYLNDIVGAADMLSGKSSSLSGVKVLDESTLQVSIDGPKPYFLQKIAFPTTFVVDKSNVASGAEWWRQPDGTGPFRLEQWQEGETLVLQRFDDYYGDKALLDKVVFHLLAGGSMQLYQLGTVDVAYVNAAYLGTVTDPNNPLSGQLNVFP
ncbi:MAG: peptide ABC transporter substrate-binding protein, partial [Dehalococcoidales bacterium]|nr:peptide ABC transporter substrate-binding protein [Dehalococcoidales bacterium]